MNEAQGWLQRSFERAHKNIQQRPQHLRPRRYRTDATTTVRETGRTSSQKKK